MLIPSLGQEGPLEEEMATHCSILAWEIPWTEKPGGLQSMELQNVTQDLATKPPQQEDSYRELSSLFDGDSTCPHIIHPSHGFLALTCLYSKFWIPSSALCPQLIHQAFLWIWVYGTPPSLILNLKVKVLVAQLCPTLCGPMDCSPPGFSVHGISQARLLEWVVISSSGVSSQSRDQTPISCIGRWIL